MSSGAGNADFLRVKTDASGNQEWNRTYGREGFDWASRLIQTSDGGYALAGSTYTSDEFGYDCWLLKTDAAGNQQWNRTFGGTCHDYAASLVQTSDGGFAVAGIKNCLNDGSYSLVVYRDLIVLGDADAWLIKTDASGNKLWDKTYGGALNDEAYFAVQTQDGGYALAATTYSKVDLWDAWVIKTDASGDIVWSQTYGGAGNDQAISVVMSVDDGFVLCGSTNTYGEGTWDMWLFKASSTPENPVSTSFSPSP